MTNESIKPPTWFWIVATVALIWNLMGVGAYLAQAFATEETLSMMSEAERNVLESRPAWATAAFAVATWGGLLGCMLLVLRKSLAKTVLIISLVGVLVQMVFNLFIASEMISYGPGEVMMAVMIPVVGIGLILFARKGISMGWIK